MFAAEHMVRAIAEKLGKDYLEIMRINFYKDGDLTHYNQKIENFPIERCVGSLLENKKIYISSLQMLPGLSRAVEILCQATRDCQI